MSQAASTQGEQVFYLSSSHGVNSTSTQRSAATTLMHLTTKNWSPPHPSTQYPIYAGVVHQFLINDILRRDAAVKDPLILPVSSIIANEPAERRSYARILDQLSLPLMQSMTEIYHFASDYTSFPDGVRSNFNLRGTEQARPVWRHLDLTSHAIYLAHVINRTILGDMRNESVHLRNHAIARAAIKEIIEISPRQPHRSSLSLLLHVHPIHNRFTRRIPRHQLLHHRANQTHVIHIQRHF
jgi:hypothetical protein